MRKIYFVLTYSGSILSKIVKTYTGTEFSHVSLSLDENLDEMYSFGRLNAYNPFIGGFVQESPKFGTFKRFYNTKSKIYSLEVSEEQYESIQSLIHTMLEEKKDYRFNTIGLFAVALHLKVRREKCFYCAEFVKYVLDSSNLELALPELIKPDDFENLEGCQVIYYGKLNQYRV